ncbi:MAG: seg [Parcubacteria group bacterium]|nr:seg [Parcubacteria group bacterium]
MSARTSSGERGSDRLRNRRRLRRRRILILVGVLFVILIGDGIYELHQPFARITQVHIFGADESLAATALSAMRGTYLGIIPRDSTLFYPEDKIREAILKGNPDIAAVSLFRNGLNGLSIRVDMRVPIARWCGRSPTQGVEEYCYIFDSSGLIYAVYASSTPTLNTFKLYAPLVGEVEEPLQATIAEAHTLPATFDFARQVGTLGSVVARIRLHDGEVDDILTNGTRISYVLGEEKAAYTALVSAQANSNLVDGSVEYIDLRFGSKVYVKRKGAASNEL